MQVQVKNSLPGIPPGIDHHAVLRQSDFFSRSARKAEQMPQQLQIVHFIQGSYVLARNHQNMNRSLGFNIFKTNGQLIFEDEGGWDLPAGDFTKNTRLHFFS
jgi:hypothetical protein